VRKSIFLLAMNLIGEDGDAVRHIPLRKNRLRIELCSLSCGVISQLAKDAADMSFLNEIL